MFCRTDSRLKNMATPVWKRTSWILTSIEIHHVKRWKADPYCIEPSMPCRIVFLNYPFTQSRSSMRSPGFSPGVVDVKTPTLQLVNLLVKLLRVRQFHLCPKLQLIRCRIPDINDIAFEDSETEAAIRQDSIQGKKTARIRVASSILTVRRVPSRPSSPLCLPCAFEIFLSRGGPICWTRLYRHARYIVNETRRKRQRSTLDPTAGSGACAAYQQTRCESAKRNRRGGCHCIS